MRRKRVAALRALLPRALRFGTVGFAGFVVDTAVVYASKAALGLYGAGMLSYLVAATCNWFLNRTWTFRDRPRAPLGRQWLIFLLATLPGLIFNRGAYAALIATVPLCAQHPILAIVAGSITGMFANFAMAHRVVFAGGAGDGEEEGKAGAPPLGPVTRKRAPHDGVERAKPPA